MLSKLARAGRAPLGLLCLLTCSCRPTEEPRAGEPADYGPVGEFRLTERSGKVVTQEDLRGKVWIASFQFTRCTAGCPQVSQTMRQLQDGLADRPDVRLVTFTVDPEHDDPEELKRYAERFGADPQHWLFLTGKEEEIYSLLHNSFHVHARQREGEERKPGSEVDHSLKLAVVDRDGLIRGYYDGLPSALPGEDTASSQEEFAKELKRLRRQVDQLLQRPTPAYLPSDVPAFNALLNAVSAILVLLGYQAIRLRLVRLHTVLMLSAILVSALFLSSYLYFHLVIKGGRPTRFAEQAIGAPVWLGYVYHGVLLSHTLLAVAVTPMVLLTAYRGLRGNLARHVALARWALPLWVYVSVTGVAVYWMLYRLYP